MCHIWWTWSMRRYEHRSTVGSTFYTFLDVLSFQTADADDGFNNSQRSGFAQNLCGKLCIWNGEYRFGHAFCALLHELLQFGTNLFASWTFLIWVFWILVWARRCWITGVVWRLVSYSVVLLATFNILSTLFSFIREIGSLEEKA